MERKLITKLDVIIGTFLTAVCFFVLFFPHNTDSLIAEINADGRIEIIDLEKVTELYEMTVTSNGHTLTLKISGDGVEIVKSDCKDKVCVSAGKLDRHNECAVCLPAKVIVRVYEKDGEEKVDGLI